MCMKVFSTQIKTISGECRIFLRKHFKENRILHEKD